MIDYIKYSVDGKTYSLVKNQDNTWSKEANAPDVTGNYTLLFEISENGMITYIDSSDSKYATFLQVIENTQQQIPFIKYLPEFLQDIVEFNVLFDTEETEFDKLLSRKDKIINDMFIASASNDAIARVENFVDVKGQGTLEQRKSYLISLFQKGKKLNENKFKEITKTIIGADCNVTFFGSDDAKNPQPGYGLIKVLVLSPVNNKDYRYEDIARALQPLIPANIKLLVIKYFATWADIMKNFIDWSAINTYTSWQTINDYIPPQ